MPEYGMTTFDENGVEWFVLDTRIKFRVPWDPNSPVYVLAAPPGGVGHSNYPFMIKGDNGLSPLLHEDADVTEIEHDDPDPVTSTWVQLSPGNPETGDPPLYKEVKTVRKGPPGADGTTTLDPSDYGSPAPKRILVVNGTSTAFEYAPQKVGGMHWASAITEAPAGTTAGHQLTSISVAANTYPFDWRPCPVGCSFVSGTTSDMQVDLVARLTNSGGAILGKCGGMVGASDRLILSPGPDTGAADSVNKIAANAAATVVFRTEKQAGTGTYSTGIIDESRVGMLVVPVP